MSREQLKEITHQLRVYLEHQRAIGAAGCVAAPDADRARFEAQLTERRKRELATIKARLNGAPPQAAPVISSPPPQSAPQRRAPEDVARPSFEIPGSKPAAPKPSPPVTSGAGVPLWTQLGARPETIFKKEQPSLPTTSALDDATHRDSPPPPVIPPAEPRAAAPRERESRREEPRRATREEQRQEQRQERDTRRSREAPEEEAAPRAPAFEEVRRHTRGAASSSAPSRNTSRSSTDSNSSNRASSSRPPERDEPSLFGEAWQEQTDPTKTAQPLAGFDTSPELVRRLERMTNADKLSFLRECLGDCTRCKLSTERTNIVFGDGDPNAELIFVGEGPGYNEDKQGVPFVGKAGQLLDRMILAMGFERDDVYIANVVKCRPPNNRDPEPDEIRKCSPYLYKQLETINPRAIVTLGRFASQCLLDTKRSMGSMRGRWQDWRGIPVMPTYHPAFLLRNPESKREAWEDLQKVMKMLGVEARK